MFKNYFKVAIRNIMKYRIFSFINVFGLAMAMSVCMLIVLMLADQMSYDQFHEKKDRTYRILSKIESSIKPNASSPFPLANTLKTEYPIIEESTHLVPGVGGDATHDRTTVEMRGFFAAPSFFKVFSFELEKGDKHSALDAPNSMIITSEVANRLFPGENPIGKTVEFVDRSLHFLDFGMGGQESPPADWGAYIITGVLADQNYKTHLKFDVLVSSASLPALYERGMINDLTDNWRTYSKCFTYVVLKPEKNEQDLATSLNDIVVRKYADFSELKGFKLIPQKLTRITPGIFVGNPISLRLPIEVYYFLSFFAVIIMLLACLNYANLSTARALSRAKEIGVRKVTGAKRKNLILQFLSESTITSLLALLMAANLLIVVKSGFMSLWVNKYLHFDLKENLSVYLIFAGLALFIGLIAGVYPAVHLSKFQPIETLRNNDGIRPGKLGIRKILSVSQFVISLFFIVTSILIFNQFRHFIDFKYGFNAENIINVELQSNDYRLISNELRSVPGVALISACDYIPTTAGSHATSIKKAGSEEESKKIGLLRTDENFVDNLELKLVAGQNLPTAGVASDHFVLVNVAAAKLLGYEHPSDIIGRTYVTGNDKETIEIIGVVEDFRFESPMLAEGIGPLMLRNQPDKFSYVNVKIAANDLMASIAALEKKWKNIDPVHPFRYEFFDEQLASTSQALGDVVSVLSFIAILAISIACLGLLGMATYTSERRTKEVGIRKILGAQEFRIALLLSKEFLVMLAISVLIAAPLSYLINSAWLQNFPNRVEFGFGTILLGAFIVLALGFITIGSQTLRASRRNPVDALRYE